jgi:hypothetical protein
MDLLRSSMAGFELWTDRLVVSESVMSRAACVWRDGAAVAVVAAWQRRGKMSMSTRKRGVIRVNCECRRPERLPRVQRLPKLELIGNCSFLD